MPQEPHDPPSGPPNSGATPERSNEDRERRARKRKRRWRWVIFVGLPITLILGALYYWFFMRPYESTDDAFIDGNVIPLAPRVAGQVLLLHFSDNQYVTKGQLLLEIDPRDFETALAQARAAQEAARTRLEQARVQVSADQAKLAQEQSNTVSAEAEAKRAEADLKRYQALEGPAVAQTQVDLAVAQARSADAARQVARSRVSAAEAQVNLSKAAVQTATAEFKRSEAAVQAAELALSYTKLVAPLDGYATHRTVEPGSYVQTGQALLALVPSNVWVTANFKETQLKHMRPGQPVKIKVDAYPQYKFRGHVDSIQRGSGARFSLLPPENASGNYVKVVQRVPVKIVFDEPIKTNLAVVPGMSAVPSVGILSQPREKSPMQKGLARK